MKARVTSSVAPCRSRIFLKSSPSGRSGHWRRSDRLTALSFVPEQGQAGPHHDRGAGEEAKSRNIAPHKESYQQRPNQHQIIERRDRGRRSEFERPCPGILPRRIREPAADEHRAIGKRWPAKAEHEQQTV